MKSKEERVCRLCLNLVTKDFEIIEETAKEIFDILLLKMNLFISEQPVMCENCSENVKTLFAFKSGCIYSKGWINPVTTVEHDIKAHLNEVFLSENKNIIDYSVCHLCMTHVERNRTPFDNPKESIGFIENILSKYFPEWDLSVTKTLIICTACRGSLESYINFLKKCWDVEEKIKEYCRAERINSTGQIELNDVRQFISKYILNDGGKINQINIIKIEEKVFENNEHKDNHVKVKIEELNVDIKEEQIDVKVDNSSLDRVMDSLFLSQSEIIRYTSALEEPSGGNSQMCGIAASKCETCLKRSAPTNTDGSNATLYINDICTCQTKHKKQAESKWNKRVHKNPSEVPMYECYICKYKSNRKSTLIRHMLVHKDASEVMMYQCEVCEYKTKLRSSLKQHVLTHKSDSEVTIYKCDTCKYKTKRQSTFKQHLLIHKDASEVTMYPCDVCDFKAKRRSTVNRHMLTHKDASEVTMYQCDICEYKAKQKTSLKQHMLSHKDASEVTLYQCEIFERKLKRKDYLRKHMLLHKDVSEATIYKCEACEYKTRHRDCFKSHVRRHEISTSSAVIQCTVCEYKAILKSDLNKHMSIHNKVKSHLCEICGYKTSYKRCLNRHILLHKNTSEITMHECKKCEFVTRHRDNLMRHMLVHKDASEVVMYQCEMCGYKTKRKRNLKKHVIIHKRQFLVDDKK